MTTVMAVVVTFLGALIGLGATVLTGADGTVASIGFGSLIGLCLGLLCGRNAARRVHARYRPKRRIAVWTTAAGAAVRDLGVLAVTVSVVICAAPAPATLTAVNSLCTKRTRPSRPGQELGMTWAARHRIAIAQEASSCQGATRGNARRRQPVRRRRGRHST
jgi:hypothetical protein